MMAVSVVGFSSDKERRENRAALSMSCVRSVVTMLRPDGRRKRALKLTAGRNPFVLRSPEGA